MSGYVYLITELDNEKYYKIGCTKKQDIEQRKKELQTGNSSELHMINYFKTDYPYKLEKMLHMCYSSQCKLNEWYELNENDVKNFKSTCQKYEDILNALKENPFFNHKRI